MPDDQPHHPVYVAAVELTYKGPLCDGQEMLALGDDVTLIGTADELELKAKQIISHCRQLRRFTSSADRLTALAKRNLPAPD